MSDTDQAQADLPEDDSTVLDPLDTRNSLDNGTSELASYEQEIYSLELNAAQTEQGDTPAEETAAEEETSETHEESSGQEDEAEEEPANASNRFRIRAMDDVEAEALALRKRHPDWSLEKCLVSAKSVLGIQEQTTATESQDHTQAETSTSITQQIKELRVKLKEATGALEFETAAEISDQIEELRDRQVDSRIAEVQEQSRAEVARSQEFDAKWEEGKRQAVAFYPDTDKPDSDISQRMIEINDWMQQNGDPIFHSPDKLFTLAKMAAAELGIPMKRPVSKGAPRPSKSPVQPASGNARTAPTNPTKRANEELEGINSLDAFEALIGAM
jgi:hypothetical protein